MMSSIWGVPVYKESTNNTLSTFSDIELDILKTARAEDDIAEDMRQNHPGQTEIVKSTGDILTKPELKRINNLIETHAERYAREVICMKQDIKQTSSWFTVAKKGDWHRPHFHRHTLFSVCFYPKAYSGNLILTADKGKNSFQQDYFLGLEYTEFNSYNCQTWSIPITSGDIVIFPGSVSHGATENESEKERWMIGANYWVSGTLSFHDELDTITI